MLIDSILTYYTLHKLVSDLVITLLLSAVSIASFLVSQQYGLAILFPEDDVLSIGLHGLEMLLNFSGIHPDI